MAKRASYRVDLEKMKNLYESLKTSPHIEVGVFSGKAPRKDGALTNADLAMYHEEGSPEHGLPARSMLRVPLHDHISTVMSSIKGQADELVVAGGAMKLYKLIGAAAYKIVLGAFATEGYGKWAPLKYATLLRKLKGSLYKRKQKIGQIYAGQIGQGILIDTGQLRRSFFYRVRMKFT